MLTLFFFFLLFWSQSTHVSCSTIVASRRRLLHQPFFPLDALPPSEPPSSPPPLPPNPNPKYPFSATPSPPNDSPFFPAFPAPPPPPSPATFASFPANISSLILPHSPSPKPANHKLVAASIAAVATAILVLAIAVLFYFRRRRNRSFSDDKTHRSENSSRLFPANAETTNRTHKLRTTSTASSEFLYLGTLVDSRRIDERTDSRGTADSGGRLDPRKLESPELHPLPPLARPILGTNCGNGEVGSTTGDDEEEEFYSPRGSLGGRDSSNDTGSGSRRVLSAIAGDKLGMSSGSSSCSCSSSSSASPNCSQSQSISYSPPVSFSPIRPEDKSPEPLPVHVSSPSPSPSSSPERVVENTIPAENVRSPSLSPISSSPERTPEEYPVESYGNRRSPSLSPIASSPERTPEEYPVESDGNRRSPSLSPIASSPERTPEEYPVESDGNRRSPSLASVSLSPNICLEKNSDASPRTSVDSGRNRHSPSLSLSSSSSPERFFEGFAEQSPRVSNAYDEKRHFLPPLSPILSRSPDSSPRSSSASDGITLELDLNRRSFSPSSSPEITSEKKLESTPRVSAASDTHRHSPSLSVSSSSSPERVLEEDTKDSPRVSIASDKTTQSPGRDLGKNPVESPIISNAYDGLSYNLDPNRRRSSSSSLSSSSPERESENNSDASPRSIASPARISNALKQTLSVPPPPPPPPPLPQFQRRLWEIPSPATPTSLPISKPPALIPPSRPFVFQNPSKASTISPMELPPSSNSVEETDETPKPKLKPLHWDKVRASSDREMVWDQLRSSSFKLNEEMIETLFIVNTPNQKPKEATPRAVLPSPNSESRVLDPKKSQNIAISLRALNVTIEEVCDALLEGNADALGSELLESLLRMAPTKEEERKLKEYKEDSPVKLGPAEKFLKAVLDVPFAFRRVDAMLYVANFESEVEYLKKSFETLEAACEELRNSRMFMKLLEAVLKTGNRMNVGTNRGDAHAFKLDTLLKLVDVKGADGKTTLLHFVVQEIIRTEGAKLCGTDENPTSTSSEDAKCRKLGLQVVSNLSSDLGNVKKAAAMDSDVLSSDVSKLSRGISNIREIVRLNETTESDESNLKFSESMDRFVKMAEEEIIRIQAQESVALSLVKEITEYFHGNSAKEEAHPFRIFLVVRDFLTVLDRVCKEVGLINERTIVSSAHKFPVPVNPMLPAGFPAPKRPYSSSDEESS